MEGLQQVEKQFLSRFPLKEWSWQDLMAFGRGNAVDQVLFQKALLKKTICHYLMGKFPLKMAYQIMFLKTFINKMEEDGIEVCDEMYEAYCDLLGKSGNPEVNQQDMHFRHFILGEKYISLSESTSIVSEGTTGLYAWPASMALAEWCLENQETILKGKRILELGSGVGLTGLACLLGTASDSVKGQENCNKVSRGIQPQQAVVESDKNLQQTGNSSSPLSFTFSDCHPSVLHLLCRNVRQNIMEDESSELDLEKSSGGCSLLETCYEGTNVRVINLLWQDLEHGTEEGMKMVGQVDVIIAADVVYDQSLFKPLIGSLKRLAAKNDEGISPKLVLACTKRNSVTLKEFMDCLLISGMLAHEEKPVHPQHFMYECEPPVGIYLISTQ